MLSSRVNAVAFAIIVTRRMKLKSQSASVRGRGLYAYVHIYVYLLRDLNVDCSTWLGFLAVSPKKKLQ